VRVQAVGRLVQQQRPRLGQQRRGQPEPLGHAKGEPARPAVGHRAQPNLSVRPPPRTRPSIRCRVVDLPAPFGPRRPVTFPGLDRELQVIDGQHAATPLGQSLAWIMRRSPSCRHAPKPAPDLSARRAKLLAGVLIVGVRRRHRRSCGVRNYRQQSPGHQPLAGCRHRQSARTNWRCSRSPSWPARRSSAGRSKARTSSPVRPASGRPSRSPRCQPATTARAAACESIPTPDLAPGVGRPGAQLHGQGRRGRPAHEASRRGGRSAAHTAPCRPVGEHKGETAPPGRPPAPQHPDRRRRQTKAAGPSSSPVPDRPPGPRRGRWRRAAPLARSCCWWMGRGTRYRTTHRRAGKRPPGSGCRPQPHPRGGDVLLDVGLQQRPLIAECGAE
jgi:hypothetical protein